MKNTINDVEFNDKGDLMVGTDLGSISLFSTDSISVKYLFPVQQFFKTDFLNLPTGTSVSY